MKLESLPNELLLDLFNYFYGTDLLRAFYGLNTRFNHLLYQQFLFYRFSFDSISKRDFDVICQQHLPCIVDQIIALRLSDHGETPEQIKVFVSYIPSFKPFIHLRSLTLIKLQSYELLVQLLDECQHLPRLTRLTLYFGCARNSSAGYQMIIDKIWSLPKLTFCGFYIRILKERQFRIPTIISTSLKCLYIISLDFQWHQINQLIEHTPNLECLSISVNLRSNYNYKASVFSKITRCNLSFYGESIASIIDVIFQNMKNLRHLEICTGSELITGYQWEHIIRTYLLKLKTFQLKMKEHFDFDTNIQQKADNLYDSFRTSFWIDERKWFIWCFTTDDSIVLHTRFNTSIVYDEILLASWRSTCPDDNRQEAYNRITRIFDETFFDQPMPSDIYLPNIKNVCIEFPLHDRFWSIVASLKHLQTLSISAYADIYQSQLEILLDQTPQLRSLCINQDAPIPLQTFFFNYIHPSIRKLDLYNCNHKFDTDQCHMLIRSSLINQCDVLSIQVIHRQNIIILVQNMLKLRSLIVKSEDDQYQQALNIENHYDELIEWLKEHLPSSYVIVRNLTDNDDDDDPILLWL